MRIVAALLALVLVGPGIAIASAAEVRLPPLDGAPDYQLGAAYPPAAPVSIVARDRAAAPPPGLYAICYINAFQTQPGEQDEWPAGTLLRGPDGAPAHDPDWPDEVLLDTRTPAQRAEIAAAVTGWIEGCAQSGYDAVEFDNLDTYSRSGGALRRDDAVTLARELVTVAHRAGLAAAQKNAAEDAGAFRAAGFDFAVAEECAAYRECAAYTDVYGAHVLDVEYADNLPRTFAEVCTDPATPAATVLRDRPLVAPADPGYRFQLCR